MQRPLELRLQTFQDVLDETPLLDLPVEFRGSAQQCDYYASSHGYTWKNSRKHVHGGYFYNKEAAHCLLPT